MDAWDKATGAPARTSAELDERLKGIDRSKILTMTQLRTELEQADKQFVAWRLGRKNKR